jgi:hypothetical protein
MRRPFRVSTPEFSGIFAPLATLELSASGRLSDDGLVKTMA